VTVTDLRGNALYLAAAKAVGCWDWPGVDHLMWWLKTQGYMVTITAIPSLGTQATGGDVTTQWCGLLSEAVSHLVVAVAERIKEAKP